MSGGHWNYIQNDLEPIIRELYGLLHYPKKYDDGSEMLNDYAKLAIKELIELLKVSRIYLTRLDWFLSGDDGCESMEEHLREALKEYYDEHPNFRAGVLRDEGYYK